MDMYDFIVIGGGSAGAVLAARLSEDRSNRVLLLEAGSWDYDFNIYVPALQIHNVGNPKYDWRYPVAPDPSRNDRADVWPAGKVMGGGSSINGMVYLRGHRADYAQWVEAGASGWGYDDVLPYYRRSERNARGADAWHGADGPVGVEDTRAGRPINRLVLDAAENLGWKRNDDVNGADQEGIGMLQSTIRNGLRSGTAREYLHNARFRGNLDILTQAQVTKIRIENRRAVGVEFEHKGQQKYAASRREVILSAGAIGSPKLLMLSGIGDAAHLAEHHIAVQSALPGVGMNLQEHPGIIVSFDVNSPTLNAETKPHHYIKHALQMAFLRKGAATTGIAHLVGFLKTRPELERPDIQLHFSPFAYDFGTEGATLVKRNACGMAINVCNPITRGRISLNSAIPTTPPLIEYQLLGDDRDLETLMRGGRMVRELFQQEPVKSVTVGERLPGVGTQSDAEWRDFIRSVCFPMYHPVGTCRMGRADDPMTVVDPELRVVGIQGLRVADASIMPTLISANTNAAAIMIGEKAADHILGHLGGKP